MRQICPYTPVIYRSTQTGKTMAGSGSVWVEVPEQTTHNDVGKYVMTKRELTEVQKKALMAFLNDEDGKCPCCLSEGVEVYPDKDGICRCGGCNELLPPDLCVEGEDC